MSQRALRYLCFYAKALAEGLAFAFLNKDATKGRRVQLCFVFMMCARG